MNDEDQQRIRELAYSLWQSAERPYWTALEYWLMAEQMILGMAMFANNEVRRRMASCPTMTDRPAASSGGGAITAETDGALRQNFENR